MTGASGIAAPERRLELLAPAKNAAIGREAILHGADAVYIGGPAFGARQGANNELADIAALVAFAHRYHARVYVTLNTILHDAELEPARELARRCFDAGVDALIVQDMGLLELDLPPIDLHASTQCDIRTPAKARFLADVGFSQIVLARELTVAEIAAVRAALPTDTVVEHFIHGALCVAYSGQCYISHAHTGRSANRGDCSQACRLPYTLEDAKGRVVAFDRHLLSMKDNNQSANLAALVDAGVSSFKIEGRYKDAAYVKNVTGHYRRLLDKLIDARPGLARASSGRTELLFTPDPERTFHRGATDYFARGRQPDIGAFDSPSFIGPAIGTVAAAGTDWLDVDTAATLANGDGLAYLQRRDVVGFRVNRAERLGATAEGGARWRVHPNEPPGSLPGVAAGTAIHRNRDHAWEQALAKNTAERRIGLRARVVESRTGFALTLTDEDGVAATASVEHPREPARDRAQAAAQLRDQLARLGDTAFTLAGVDVEFTGPWFVPASVANRLRRDAVDALGAARLAAHRRLPRKAAVAPPVPYPESVLTYLGNVYNGAARAFYARHGVEVIGSAYEAHDGPGEVSLMITRHCLRYSFSLCPKQAKGVTGVQGQVRAEPMSLVGGGERLTLRFDCKRCEMHVVGRMKKSVACAPPPGSPAPVPVTFVPRGGARSAVR
jgi:putative protease